MDIKLKPVWQSELGFTFIMFHSYMKRRPFVNPSETSMLWIKWRSLSCNCHLYCFWSKSQCLNSSSIPSAVSCLRSNWPWLSYGDFLLLLFFPEYCQILFILHFPNHRFLCGTLKFSSFFFPRPIAFQNTNWTSLCLSFTQLSVQSFCYQNENLQ